MCKKFHNGVTRDRKYVGCSGQKRNFEIYVFMYLRLCLSPHVFCGQSGPVCRCASVPAAAVDLYNCNSFVILLHIVCTVITQMFFSDTWGRLKKLRLSPSLRPSVPPCAYNPSLRPPTNPVALPRPIVEFCYGSLTNVWQEYLSLVKIKQSNGT